MRILIIGNGFDIAHGLPTSYRDFLEFAKLVLAIYTFQSKATVDDYETLLQKNWSCSKLTADAVTKIKEQLKLFFETRKLTLTLNNGSLLSYNTVALVNERLDKFYAYLKDNVWYKYISELYKNNKLHGKNWIDFESEISAVIQAVDEKHKSLNQTFFELRNFLARDTDNEELKAKLEEFSYTYSPAYKSKDSSTVDSLRERLYSDLEDLILALEIYLVDFVETVKVDPLPQIDVIKPDHVISFNYTTTYERVYRTSENNEDVCYIHGVVGGGVSGVGGHAPKNNKNNMILGIDEYLPKEQRFKKTDFSIFKKFVQRIRKHNDVRYSNWMEEIDEHSKTWPSYVESMEGKYIPDEKRKLRFASDVYIYGHSLDVTDKDILERFIASEYTRVYIYAHSKASEGDLISHMLRYIDEEVVVRKASREPRMLEFRRTKVTREN